MNIEHYEALVDWPARLARESPFYRKWFEAAGVRRVLDAACGTGHHAALFHSWGLEVEGADLDPDVIEYCRRHHPGDARLRWAMRSYDEPCPAPGYFDAAICVGNSLALAENSDHALRAVRRLVETVRSGGLSIIQVLNLWHLPVGPTVWQKCKRARLGDAESILLKGVHRVGDLGHITMVQIGLDGRMQDSGGRRLLGFSAFELETQARAAGAASVAFFGDYHDTAYDAEASGDLIVVARKG
jgi:SAM-dependent methyltransferase